MKTPSTSATMTRRTLLAGLGATLASPAMAKVATKPRIAPKTRRFWMQSIHTHEKIDVIYYRNGKYDQKALQAIYRFMRDWRTGDVVEMDLHAINLWADLHAELGSNSPFQLISGYRSPKSNEKLRNASANSGVAKKSYHTRGMAADLRLSDRSLEQIAKAASRIGAGGIGIYAKSNFVHVDVGRPRTWRG